MVHVRPSLIKKVTGKDADTKLSVPTYDEMVRLAPELGKVEKGVAGIGLMGARGFWATYTWEHVAAQHGMDLFDADWQPIFNGDAGVKALETILALNKSAAEGVAGWGWGEDRAAWLGGQLAIEHLAGRIRGTQATRPDQSRIVGDVLTIYEPRAIEGARFAPPNIAGSTSCVTASAQNPEGAFLMLAFLTTASIMAMNEANANGVAPGYKSVLANDKLQEVSQPADGVGRIARLCLVRAAHPGHVRDGAGARQRDQQGAGRPGISQGGARRRRRGLEGDHDQERLLLRPGAVQICGRGRRRLGRQGQEAAGLTENRSGGR